MAKVLIGLGSNEGDRQAWIDQAEKLIAEIHELKILKKSSMREYEAVEQAEGQAPFLNGVIEVDVELMPNDLLHKLQVIERRLGRAAKGDGSARTIDLDILAYDDVVIEGKTLIVPHPRMHLRKFVLEPLMEILPGWTHPKSGSDVKDLISALTSETQSSESSINENPSEPHTVT